MCPRLTPVACVLRSHHGSQHQTSKQSATPNPAAWRARHAVCCLAAADREAAQQRQPQQVCLQQLGLPAAVSGGELGVALRAGCGLLWCQLGVEQVQPTRSARLLKAAAIFVVPAAGEGRWPELREPSPHPGGLRTAVLSAHMSVPVLQIETEASSLMCIIIKASGRPAKCCMQLPTRISLRISAGCRCTAVGR